MTLGAVAVWLLTVGCGLLVLPAGAGLTLAARRTRQPQRRPPGSPPPTPFAP
ncbi:hypothetical protein K1Y80_31715 [Streptomyces sp. MAG02]|nr:hypothetical protein [Streptomyces sp. MAG02]